MGGIWAVLLLMITHGWVELAWAALLALRCYFLIGK